MEEQLLSQILTQQPDSKLTNISESTLESLPKQESVASTTTGDSIITSGQVSVPEESKEEEKQEVKPPTTTLATQQEAPKKFNFMDIFKIFTFKKAQPTDEKKPSQ